MSRSASTFTVAVLLFFTFFAIFASAAPTNVTCDEPDVKSRPDTVDGVPPVPSAPPKVDNSTDTTNTTVVDDGSSDEYGVVNLESINTLATSATYSGTATWFNPGLGACGSKDTDSSIIVALASPNWSSGSHCNKNIQITNPKNGRVKTAAVRDLCPGCGSGDLDMSPALFKALADNLDLGVFPMTWKFL